VLWSQGAERLYGILDDLGLAAAIEWQAKDFHRRSGIFILFKGPEEDLDVSREQATAFFRIFQEIPTNIARHSEARKVWVNLEVQKEMLILEVEEIGSQLSLSAKTISTYRSRVLEKFKLKNNAEIMRCVMDRKLT
jgi:signal transduction histidine kinase